MDFWGVHVRAYVPTAADAAYLMHHFSDYISEGSENVAVSMWLFCEDHEVAFLDAVRVERWEKFIYVDVNDGPFLWERWRGKASRGSPLPPFPLVPLVDTVHLRHAAAACPPQSPDHAVLIHGASRSGKSSVLLSLLARGWWFVADDTVPVAGDDVLTYMRPVNLREEALESHPSLRDRYGGRGLRVLTQTGWTHMVPPRDLGVGIAGPRSKHLLSVFLRPSETWAAVSSPRGLEVNHDVNRDLQRTVQVIEDRALRLIESASRP